MKDSGKTSENIRAAIAIVLGILFYVVVIGAIIWCIFSPSKNSQNNEPLTPEEQSEYDDYKDTQDDSSDGAEEACMDQMDRDVERYGEWVANTYDCTKK